MLGVDFYKKYKKSILCWAILALITGTISNQVLGDYFLLFFGPIISFVVIEIGTSIYKKTTGKTMFEGDDNSWKEEDNPFIMGTVSSLIDTLAIMSSAVPWLIFK